MSVLLLLTGAAAIAGCGRQTDGAMAVAPTAGERFVVRAQEAPDYKPVAATVTTRDVADARARIGGVLVSLTVKAGDTVKRGQVIGVVRDERIGLQTRAYDAQVAAAEAEADRAQADLSRTEDLYQHGVYAKARLEQVRAAAHSADGALKAARAQRDASAESVAQGAIVAAADGRVLKADVPAGSVVAPGQPIATVTAGPPVVRIEVPEADAAGLELGQAFVLPDGSPATVVQVYPAVEGGRVTADLSSPGLTADRVGRRLSVNLPIGRRPALLIPRRFVTSRFGVDYVTVLGAQGVVETPVQLSAGAGANVEALSGVSQGDVLVAPAQPGRGQ